VFWVFFLVVWWGVGFVGKSVERVGGLCWGVFEYCCFVLGWGGDFREGGVERQGKGIRWYLGSREWSEAGDYSRAGEVVFCFVLFVFLLGVI